MKKKAFINGKIYTVNKKQPLAETVVIDYNRILFTGSIKDAQDYIDSSTEIIDLEGKLMLPGFTDAHVHFIKGGAYLEGINLRPAKSLIEFRKLLKNYISGKTKKGEWITGGEWDHESWEVIELPSKENIDDISPDNPVFVNRFDQHIGLANSLALKIAGIDKNTPDPAGGTIVRDLKTGEPTGILKDMAIELINSVLPEPSDEKIYQFGLTALAEAAKFGVTAVHDITLPHHLKEFQELEKNGKLTCRIYTRLPIAGYKNLSDSGIQYNFGSKKIKTGSLKAYADGSLGAMTAWFFEPYVQDKNTSGLPMDIIINGSLKKWALDADKNKLQISVHAIGDKANSYLLDMFREIKDNNPQWDRRFRIEHAQHLHQQDIKRFAETDVIVSAQPYHLIDDGVWAEKRIGQSRLKYSYAYRSLLDEGVKLCFGSDWVVAPLNPLTGIYAAVTRRTTDNKNPDGWFPEQKITVAEAIECYTINNAYASFSEDETGSIEAGKFADFAVLDQDILTIDPGKIKDVKVVMTIFDGNIIYKEKYN